MFRAPRGRESLRTATSEHPVVPRISAAQRQVLTELCRPCATGSSAVPASTRQIAAFALGDLPQHQKRATLAQRALASGVVSLADLEPR